MVYVCVRVWLCACMFQLMHRQMSAAKFNLSASLELNEPEEGRNAYYKNFYFNQYLQFVRLEY